MPSFYFGVRMFVSTLLIANEAGRRLAENRLSWGDTAFLITITLLALSLTVPISQRCAICRLGYADTTHPLGVLGRLFSGGPKCASCTAKEREESWRK